MVSHSYKFHIDTEPYGGNPKISTTMIASVDVLDAATQVEYNISCAFAFLISKDMSFVKVIINHHNMIEEKINVLLEQESKGNFTSATSSSQKASLESDFDDEPDFDDESDFDDEPDFNDEPDNEPDFNDEPDDEDYEDSELDMEDEQLDHTDEHTQNTLEKKPSGQTYGIQKTAASLNSTLLTLLLELNDNLLASIKYVTVTDHHSASKNTEYNDCLRDINETVSLMFKSIIDAYVHKDPLIASKSKALAATLQNQFGAFSKIIDKPVPSCLLQILSPIVKIQDALILAIT